MTDLAKIILERFFHEQDTAFDYNKTSSETNVEAKTKAADKQAVVSRKQDALIRTQNDLQGAEEKLAKDRDNLQRWNKLHPDATIENKALGSRVFDDEKKTVDFKWKQHNAEQDVKAARSIGVEKPTAPPRY